MAAVTFLLALLAAIAGFVLSYAAAGFGIVLSLLVGYLCGSIAAVAIVLITIVLGMREPPKPGQLKEDAPPHSSSLTSTRVTLSTRNKKSIRD